MQKLPKYLITIWANLKNIHYKQNLLWLLFGQLLEKLGATFLFKHLGTLSGNGTQVLVVPLLQGESPALVVMAGDSRLRGHEFVSQVYNFLHLFVV